MATAVTALAVPLTAMVVAAAPASALTMSPSGTVSIAARGNGHGHGMSQYGAEGAAVQGLSYSQILKFYYPGTTVTTLPSSRIRVLLSATGTTVRVRVESGLQLTGVGALATTGIGYYRLVASGTTETLQALKTGSRTWTTVRTGLPNRSAFTRGPGHSTRLWFIDNTEGRYFGQLRAVISGSGLQTVDVVNLDSYVRGVVPYEIPRSWRPAALAAQAVAARTYGRYSVEHPRGSEYDICDNSNCQVYNGYQQYSPTGQLTATDDGAVLTGNSRQVLQYQGRTIFAEFSASNGGWTAAGGQPYLVAKPDPYDSAGGADPYTAQSRTVKVSQLASYFGLSKATGISITRRDGNGVWGGRILSGYIQGATASGTVKVVNFTGYDLQWALGLGTTWINVTAG